jgi:hypothetical protein
MRWGPSRIIVVIVVIVILVVIGNRIDGVLFPWEPCGKLLTIRIDTVQGAAQASALNAHRLANSYVRWDNRTASGFHLKFSNKPTPDDDLGPIEDGIATEIEVLPNTPTGYYRIANRAAEKNKVIHFFYHSTTTPLSGPPGEPGMTVEN